jgi:hypothetical protein
MREGYRQLEGLVGDLKAVIARLLASSGASRPAAEHPAATEAAPESPPPQPAAGPARASEGDGLRRGELEARQLASTATASEERGVEMAEALALAVERLRQRAEAAVAEPVQPSRPPLGRQPHKHSMSLVRRWRIRRKQRRGR